MLRYLAGKERSVCAHSAFRAQLRFDDRPSSPPRSYSFFSSETVKKSPPASSRKTKVPTTKIVELGT